MTTRRFALWLFVFLSGSGLWLFASGSMWWIGFVLIWVALFVASPLGASRPDAMNPGRAGMVATLIFLNVVPTFVAGWEIYRPDHPSVPLKAVYVLVACAVIASNAYRMSSHVKSRAA